MKQLLLCLYPEQRGGNSVFPHRKEDHHACHHAKEYHQQDKARLSCLRRQRGVAGILVMMGASCMIVMMVGVFIHRGRS
jgi:hypothetical protein